MASRESGNPYVLVTGAAGFIGSHLVDRLIQRGHFVLGVDDLSRGSMANLEWALRQREFEFLELDLTDSQRLRELVAKFPIDVVWHMVANSDIAAGVADPAIDLEKTFLTTFKLLGAMRDAMIRRIAFASTSAVYGVNERILTEDTGPLFPISNYGAMKLASEATISAAVESFLHRAWIFRFPNVVGPRATHGIIFDLLRKLEHNASELPVLGDGTQQKPYLHVSELLDAMLLIRERADDPLNCFNIGPEDEGVTVLRIAQMIVDEAAPSAVLKFSGGKKGWVGDVPTFRYSIEKIRRLGWTPKMTSAEAVGRAVREIHEEFRAATSVHGCKR
jgi:UDP-glucose 4-epimerase